MTYAEKRAAELAAQSPNKKEMTKEQRAEKRESARLAEQTFRLLAVPGTEQQEIPDFYETAYFHELFHNNKGHKLYCPQMNDGQPCPFCEKLDSDSKNIQEQVKNGTLIKGAPDTNAAWTAALKNKPRKFYIFRVVNREYKGHGVKLWRVAEGKPFKGVKNEDAFDQIYNNLIKLPSNVIVTDPQTGRDLTVYTKKKYTPAGAEYFEVSHVSIKENPSVLDENPETVQKWLTENNGLAWRDIYRATVINGATSNDPPRMSAYEFLRAASEGRMPKFVEKEGWLLTNPDGSTTMYNRQAAQAAAGPQVPQQDVQGGVSMLPPTPVAAPTPQTYPAGAATSPPTPVKAGSLDDDLPF